MKLLFGILLLLSMVLFAVTEWGGALTGAAKNGQTLAELNPEKIRLLDVPLPKPTPASVALPVPQTAAISASVASSTPAIATALPAPSVVPAPLPASAPIPLPAPVPAPLVKAAATKSCLEWGEFSGTDLASATKELAVLKLGDHLAQRVVEYDSGYWVFIPPLKNQAAVNKKIGQLKAAGVNDYFVVQESGKWHNAISLGVFKTEEAAKKFQISIKKKGVGKSKVGERKHKLKFIVFVFKHIEADGVARLVALQKDFANSELKTVACK